ncbi:diguanylate cyclase (GGDEF) domain-containing protein [Marinospirillum celere]|uniref:Diguanylate cyclase (GGDEF) domain-containing protein n=1 Tax=Marinospirillum celere TaxID=1122252 RepID=A0A1I1I311_9GAMM|nr:EAL domain-containing protein [Marinospirillum celere]SFC27600.1 diguanylate cyclase (GGDEF) domain-containing protein [Marinospirillum celere]
MISIGQSAVLPFLRLKATTSFKPLVMVFLGLGLLLSAELSRYFTLPDQQFSALWPPAGIFLASLLILGWRCLWVLIPVMLVWSLFLQQAHWFFALSFVTGLTLGSSVAALLIQRLGRTPLKKLTFKFLMALYVKGAVLGSGLVSLFGALGFWVSEVGYSGFAFHDIWLVYWGFEALGVVLFTPLAVLALLKGKRYLIKVWIDFKRPELLIWLMVSTGAALLTLLLETSGHNIYATVLAYTFFPLLCWLVMTARIETSVLIIPVFAGFFVAFSLLGWGGLQVIEDIQGLVRLLLQIAAMVVMAQLIASINTERGKLILLFKRQARIDYLTGLDNERELNRELQQLLDPKEGSLRQQAVTPWLIYIDVLDFEEIGDLIGFEGGHGLEQQIARQLRTLREPDEQIARLGPGRYALTLGKRTGIEIELLLAATYQALNDQEFTSGRQTTRIRVSIGAIPMDGELDTPARYLSAAHQASLLGRQSQERIYLARESRPLVEGRQRLTEKFESLKRALPENRLLLYAQPIASIQKEATELSFEILLRMQSPDGEILPPVEFLPAAETFGFMLEIDHWVIRNTLQALASNPEWLARTAKCGINLSGASLSSPDLANFIADQLEVSGVPAKKISFEVTETETIRDARLAAQIITQLRELGVSVALDDFGTGLATFDYLRSYEFDCLKIDGVFIRNLETSKVDQSMVRATCEVAKSLGLETIAEFVEGSSLIGMLTELGVNYAQGYGVGRPQPLGDFFAEDKRRLQA